MIDKIVGLLLDFVFRFLEMAFIYLIDLIMLPITILICLPYFFVKSLFLKGSFSGNLKELIKNLIDKELSRYSISKADRINKKSTETKSKKRISKKH